MVTHSSSIWPDLSGSDTTREKTIDGDERSEQSKKSKMTKDRLALVNLYTNPFVSKIASPCLEESPKRKREKVKSCQNVNKAHVVDLAFSDEDDQFAPTTSKQRVTKSSKSNSVNEDLDKEEDKDEPDEAHGGDDVAGDQSKGE